MDQFQISDVYFNCNRPHENIDRNYDAVFVLSAGENALRTGHRTADDAHTLAHSKIWARLGAELIVEPIAQGLNFLLR